jgi:DNA mismatch repair protein MutL
MAEPAVSFTLRDVSAAARAASPSAPMPKPGDLFDALRGGSRILGARFRRERPAHRRRARGLRLTGFAALPTYSRGAAVAQYLFVNGRPVRDKLLSARCAAPMPISSAATGTRRRRCSSTATRCGST